MTTQTVSLTTNLPRAGKRTPLPRVRPMEYAAKASRWLVAGAVALSVIIGGVWLATEPPMARYLSAGLWAAGFVFFALALEVNIKRIFPLIATGLVLPTLALLGSHVASEFLALAVAVIAGWMATWIARSA